MYWGRVRRTVSFEVLFVFVFKFLLISCEGGGGGFKGLSFDMVSFEVKVRCGGCLFTGAVLMLVFSIGRGFLSAGEYFWAG